MVSSFVWNVPRDGFAWCPNDDIEDYLLSPRPVQIPGPTTQRISFPTTQYKPLLDFSGLFRTFADTSLSQDGILLFANRFGALEDRCNLLTRDRQDRHIGHALDSGERYAWWRGQIVAMQKALELWQHLDKQSTDALAPFIVWQSGGPLGSSVSYLSHPNLSPSKLAVMEPESEEIIHFEIVSEKNRELWPRLSSPKDVLLAATHALKLMIESQLKNSVSAELCVPFDGQAISLEFAPTNLRSALWLQLARAVSTKLQYRRCQTCRIWFELSPKVARTSRLFCRDGCKSRMYRKKQETARQMHTHHKKLREIAKALNSDATTVKRWITGIR